MKDPQGGAVMRGCGGLRLVYLHIPEAETIALLDVYDKDEADDLTPGQRRLLALVAQKIREELLNQ